MKMKVTIYTLAKDTDDDGTTDEIFGTQAELEAAQKRIIEDDINGDITEAGDMVRDFLEEGDIEGAWDKWDADIRDPTDTYGVDEQEVTIEAPEFVAELLAACEEFVRFSELPDVVTRGQTVRYQVSALSAARTAILKAHACLVQDSAQPEDNHATQKS